MMFAVYTLFDGSVFTTDIHDGNDRQWRAELLAFEIRQLALKINNLTRSII